MLENLFIIAPIQLHPHEGLGLVILVLGALFTAAVGVSVASFYIDDYWADEDYRNQLRFNKNDLNRRNLEKLR